MALLVSRAQLNVHFDSGAVGMEMRPEVCKLGQALRHVNPDFGKAKIRLSTRHLSVCPSRYSPMSVTRSNFNTALLNFYCRCSTDTCGTT